MTLVKFKGVVYDLTKKEQRERYLALLEEERKQRRVYRVDELVLTKPVNEVHKDSKDKLKKEKGYEEPEKKTPLKRIKEAIKKEKETIEETPVHKIADTVASVFKKKEK